MTLTGYTLAQLPGRHPRSAVQFPVPVGVVSPSTGMVTAATPLASTGNPDKAMAGDCVSTAPRPRPLSVSSKAERDVIAPYTV